MGNKVDHIITLESAHYHGPRAHVGFSVEVVQADGELLIFRISNAVELRVSPTELQVILDQVKLNERKKKYSHLIDKFLRSLG